MICKSHPKYRWKYIPRGRCITCWWLYLRNHRGPATLNLSLLLPKLEYEDETEN